MPYTKRKNLTFENFLFHFYNDFTSLLDFDNSDYKLLLERIDLIVKTQFDRENWLTSDKSKLELIKELMLNAYLLIIWIN